MGAAQSTMSRSPYQHFLEAQKLKAMNRGYTVGSASPFYFSCKEGRLTEVLRVLDDEASPPIEVLNELQPNGSTALHAATFYNQPEIVKLLLARNCPRTTLNRYGKIAYEEAKTEEMKQLFHRDSPVDRFCETDVANTIAVYLPQRGTTEADGGQASNYIQLFTNDADVLNYALNQQTLALWVRFYDWFSHTFMRFVERDELQVNKFDLNNHPDFIQFLKQTIPEDKRDILMKSINLAIQSNSIEPLIKLYTSEAAGFYGPFNQLLGQSSSSSRRNSHLCDRFITEFYIHHRELKRYAYTGTTYRGALMTNEQLAAYRQAWESNPPGVIGLKAFTSTSVDPLVALNFAFRAPPDGSQKHVVFVFEITEPSSGIFGAEHVSEYPHEREVLILPGNLFIVTKIEEIRNPPVTRIYLRHWHVKVSFWDKIKHTIQAGSKPVTVPHRPE